MVECLFNKVKRFRRVFSCYDKFADTYLSFLQIAATLILGSVDISIFQLVIPAKAGIQCFAIA